MSNDKNASVVVHIPTKEDACSKHVELLLDILHNLQPYVVNPQGHEEALSPEIDGGVVMAAANTFVLAAARLDSLIQDDARWNLTEVQTLHAELITTQQAQQKFLAAQTASAEEMRRPAFQCRPAVYSFEEKFYAIWGDVTVTGGSVIGEGATPTKALLDFDSAFHRTPKEQVALVIENLNLGSAIPPKKSKRLKPIIE